MLLAYIDEIGETGAFVARDHPMFNTSPAFGYAGLVVPEGSARPIGQAFAEAKRTLFASELATESAPAQWERKGADLFRTSTLHRHPQQLRVFNGLVRKLRSLGGSLFYYADEKPIGTPKQTNLHTVEREAAAMKEILNRIARHADERDQNVLVMMDQVNEKHRVQRMPVMYAHMFSRCAQFDEMKRIVEPPMHIDSAVSVNIQFADWVAACISRALDYQLRLRDAYYGTRLTQAELAARLGNSRSRLRTYISGTVTPSMDVLVAVEQIAAERRAPGLALNLVLA
ncbi:MAG: DUF3800 domain-containing protein [Microbacterium sp.]